MPENDDTKQNEKHPPVEKSENSDDKKQNETISVVSEGKPFDSNFLRIVEMAIDQTDFKKITNATNPNIDRNEIKLYFQKWIHEENITIESFKNIKRKSFISHRWIKDLEMMKSSATRLHTNIVKCISMYLYYYINTTILFLTTYK